MTTINPLKDPIPIHSIDHIDLDSHAVIEASAGTGKTYTIENLVIELLKSGKVINCEEILVVTFTEKAAAEIKERIRLNLTTAMENDPSETLRMSLENFDSTSIFTIHGFCNKLLQEYAFENDEQFQGQLADDRSVYQLVLHHIMRDLWPARFGTALSEVLSISRYPGSIVNGLSSWENQIIEISLRFQPFGNDRLIPGHDVDIISALNEMKAQCQTCLHELEQLIGYVDPEDSAKSDFPIRYASLNINKNSMSKRLRTITRIVELVRDHKNKSCVITAIDDFISSLSLGDQGFHELNTRWNKDGADYKEKLPHLPGIIEVLEKLRSLDIATLRLALTTATVHDVKRLAHDHKKENGLVSYDDMITRVYCALSAKNSLLKRALQRKYRYALVDEFQDTDMLQWRIFSSIFLNSEQNRLFIIGDPKQSIYGFRGADVQAYFIARDEMIHSFHAAYYCLEENWRSIRSLIDSYNVIFADKKWFTDGTIHYLPSRYPERKIHVDSGTDASLIVLDCGTCSGSAAKYKSARHIALAIRGMISADPSINLNDIAILVTKWKEAEAIEKFLKKEKIHYSLYKKEGLFQSKEALEIQLLLSVIANPHDLMARKKALLTRFFRVPLHQLFNYTGTLPDHPADRLLERWLRMASGKKWSLIFQSFLEDTGIVYCSDLDDHDRALINYRSIMQNLDVEAYRKNFCIQDLLDHLANLRRRDSSAHDDYNIHAIDLDNPGVQILTIHASKGLQFKTVFIAGGYTKKRTAPFWTYHSDSGRVFDLVMSPDHQSLYDSEASSEEERLFYVALTRTQDKLYIPVFQPGNRSRSRAGILGDKLYSALGRLRNEDHVEWLAVGTAFDENTAIIAEPSKPAIDITIPDPLFPEQAHTFLDRRIRIDSFSGLKAAMKPGPIDQMLPQFGTGFPYVNDYDEALRIAGFASSYPKAIHDLPHGKDTGTMLHSILEQIDFQRAGNASDPSALTASGTETCTIIESAIQIHMTEFISTDMAVLRDQTARIIWHTINAPLNGSDLVLKNLRNRIHEIEFHYPLPADSHFMIPETEICSGFMHGFIDMIFLFNDKYYIIDWKSNYIEDGYSSEAIENNVRIMHYDLQMNIYATALIRWLKNLIPEFNYELHFGGIYYLYLRGMDRDNPERGIYFYRPDKEENIYRQTFNT